MTAYERRCMHTTALVRTLHVCLIPFLSKEPLMKRATGIRWMAAAAVLTAALVTVSLAQPPERPDGPPDRGGPAEGAGGAREGRGGPGGQGGPREMRGGPGGPPSPERLVEHAMSFDADGDGKLDRSELMKFAEDMQRMRGGRGGPGGSRGGPEGRSGRGPDGSGGFGGPGGGPPSSSEDRERPARPWS